MNRIVSVSFALLIFAAVSGGAFAQAQGLGLAERRALKEYQETKYVEIKKQIDQAAGFELKVSVQWEKIAGAGDASHYLEEDYFTKVYFIPLIDALKEITKDEMGKAAAKEKLKEVVVTNDSSAEAAASFKNGLLLLNYPPWTNSAYFNERTQQITKVLEAGM